MKLALRLLPLIAAFLGSVLLPVTTADPDWLMETIGAGRVRPVAALGSSAVTGAVIGSIIGWILYLTIQRKTVLAASRDQPVEKLAASVLFVGILFSLVPSLHFIGLAQWIIITPHYSPKMVFGFGIVARATLLVLSILALVSLFRFKKSAIKWILSYFFAALGFEIVRPIAVTLLVSSRAARAQLLSDMWIFIFVPPAWGIVFWGAASLALTWYARRSAAPQKIFSWQSPPPQVEQTCLTCGATYRPEDYSNEAAAWYCSSCKAELPKG
ncbi:MAG: hypothetical protein HY695_24750 [Deltaproteobacteria bacterium]|nr:hypothetical protein [Deltaproteobacteria bacterium]